MDKKRTGLSKHNVTFIYTHNLGNHHSLRLYNELIKYPTCVHAGVMRTDGMSNVDNFSHFTRIDTSKQATTNPLDFDYNGDTSFAPEDEVPGEEIADDAFDNLVPKGDADDEYGDLMLSEEAFELLQEAET